MKLELELAEIPDTTTDKLLAFTNGAKTQLKLKKEAHPFAPYLGRDSLALTIYHEGKSYGIPVESILQAFLAQLP